MIRVIQSLPVPDTPVFCRACVYYARARQDDVCLHVAARREMQTYWGPQVTRMPPCVRNARNDCPDFTPLTWRTLGRWFVLVPARLALLPLLLALLAGLAVALMPGL